MTKTTTPVPATNARARTIAWRNAVFCIFVLSGLCLASWVTRIPAVRDSLHLDTQDVGLLILCLSVGAILGLIASAPVLARIGARRGISAALVTVAIGLLLVGFGTSAIHSVVVVGIGLAVLGFGNGSVDVMMNVEAATVEREIGKTIMPIMHGGFSVGTVAGAGIGTLAAALNVDVSVHLAIVAVITIVGVIVAVRFIPRRAEVGDLVDSHAPKPAWRTRLRDNLSVWTDATLILIGLVMLGMAFAEGSANDWLTLAVVDGHHQTDPTGAFVYGIFVAAMTVGRFLGGPLVDRVGRVTTIRITASLAIVGLLLFILGGPLWVVIAGAILWGAGCSLGFPLGMSAAADDEKNAAARVSAVAMIGYCAFLVGPPVMGFLGQAFGLLNALYLVLALVVLSALCAPALRSRSHQS